MNKKNGREYFSIEYYLGGDESLIITALDLYAKNQTDLTDINRVLELYNIKLFFDAKGNYFGWNENKYEKYKKSTENAIYVVKQFFDSVTVENLVAIYRSCEVELWDTFWEFFYKFHIFENISKDQFGEIISELEMPPEQLLEYKDFVHCFDDEIVAKLKDAEYSASFFASYFFEKRSKNKKCYLPTGLKSEDIIEIFEAYIKGNKVNPNTLTLIAEAKLDKSTGLNISDTLRIAARNRRDKYWKDNYKHIIKQDSDVLVSFSPDVDCMQVKKNDNSRIGIYDLKWVSNNLDYPTLLNNFLYLFGFVDCFMRCTLVSMPNLRSVFEDITMVKGNGMFLADQKFILDNAFADCQIKSYTKVLAEYDVYLEDICKWFFEVYLKDEFGVAGIVSTFPQNGMDVVSKCILLSSAMEGVIKQYKMYVEQGEIDRALYEFSSDSVDFKSIPSFFTEKYAYINDVELFRAINLLFSNHSNWMRVVEDDYRYQDLYQLLSGEISSDDYNNKKAKEEIDWLIDKGYCILRNGEVVINRDLKEILQQFHNNNYICIQYMDSPELRRLIAEKKVRVSGTLLSEPETEYINYLLNMKEFSNGLQLRNKYIHNAIPADEEQRDSDYVVLMKVMIILIIKINEEFCLRDKLQK